MTRRITYRWLKTNFMNAAVNLSYGDLKKKIRQGPRYELLEWVMAPIAAEEAETIRDSADELFVNENSKRARWKEALFAHLLPEILLGEVHHAALHKAVRRLSEAYPDEIRSFAEQLPALEMRLLRRVELKLLLGEAAVRAEAGSRRKLAKDFRELLERLPPAPVLREEAGKLAGRYTGLKKALQQEEDRAFFAALPDLLAGMPPEHDREIPPSVETFFLHGSRADEESRALHGMYPYLLAIGAMPSIHRYAASMKERYEAVGLQPAGAFDSILSVVGPLESKYRELNSYADVLSGARSLDELESIGDFILCEGHLESVLQHVMDNPCSARAKNVCFIELLRSGEFPWDAAFKRHEELIYRFVGQMAEGDDPGQAVSALLQPRILAHFGADAGRFCGLLLAERHEWLWLCFLEPGKLEETLIARAKLTPADGLYPLLATMLLELGAAASDRGAKATLYRRYWEHAFRKDPEFVRALPDRPALLKDYVRLGGQAADALDWLRSEAVQKKLTGRAREAFDKRDADRLQELAVVLDRDRQKLLAREWLLLDRDEADKICALKPFGYELIGAGCVSLDVTEQVERHPHRFEQDTEPSTLEGVVWRYFLVRPGLLETAGEDVVTRAVVRAELDSDEVIDRLFDDLRSI